MVRRFALGCVALQQQTVCDLGEKRKPRNKQEEKESEDVRV